MNKNEIYKEFIKIIKKKFDNYYSCKNKNINEEKELRHFYVLNNPYSSSTKGIKKFSDYGISSPSEYKKIIKKIKNIVGNDNYIFIKKGGITENELIKFKEQFENNKELIIFIKNDVGQLDALFTRLRNSFAHSNLFKTNKKYVLWNENKESLSLMCILSFNSLVNIKELICKNK